MLFTVTLILPLLCLPTTPPNNKSPVQVQRVDDHDFSQSVSNQMDDYSSEDDSSGGSIGDYLAIKHKPIVVPKSDKPDASSITDGDYEDSEVASDQDSFHTANVAPSVIDEEVNVPPATPELPKETSWRTYFTKEAWWGTGNNTDGQESVASTMVHIPKELEARRQRNEIRSRASSSLTNPSSAPRIRAAASSNYPSRRRQVREPISIQSIEETAPPRPATTGDATVPPQDCPICPSAEQAVDLCLTVSCYGCCCVCKTIGQIGNCTDRVCDQINTMVERMERDS